MEFILIMIIISVLCIIFQISTELIVLGIIIVAVIIILIMTLMFFYFFICLLCSEKHEAYFSGIDQTEKNKLKKAYYIIDNTEYPCIFPAENIFVSKLYKNECKYYVRLNKRINCVYDSFAIATCIIGFFTSSIIMISVAVIYWAVFR